MASPYCHPSCLSGIPACGAEDQHRKADALSLLTGYREVSVRRNQRALLLVLLKNGSDTADDVQDLVELPPGTDSKCLSAAPSAFARDGLVRTDGFVKTCRPEGCARSITVEAFADRHRAMHWLNMDPALAAPGEGRRQGVLPFLQEDESGVTAGTAAPGVEV